MKTRYNPFNPQPTQALTVQTPAPAPTRVNRKPKKPRTTPTVARAASTAASTAEALARAQTERSLANYPRIIEEFSQRGIPITEIKPRENVFTFQAWLAQGRAVRKGEHGVRILTVIPIKNAAEDGTAVKTRPWSATVFHISQTDPVTKVAAALQPALPPPTPPAAPTARPASSWRDKYLQRSATTPCATS